MKVVPLLRRLGLSGAVALASALGACGGDDEDLASPRAGDAGTGGDGAAADGGGSTPGTTDSGGPTTPSPGCNGGTAKDAAKGLATNLSLDVAGNARSYDLSVPNSYDPTKAYPVVFVFHGGGGTSANARNTFKFESFVGDKAIFVYPQGEGNQWDLDTPAAQNPDVAFFDQLLAKLQGELCVDSSRVFATGFSNGGYQSNQLACRRGSKLRAIVPHGGGGPYEGDDGYDANGNLICNGTPPAVMIVHGQNDGVVDVSEAKSSLKHWKWANKCTDESSPRAPSPCVAYSGCAVPTVYCEIPGVGHSVWNQGAQATWDFFASF